MVALQIRDVPQETRDALAQRAEACGQSLQAFLLSVVEEEANRSRNLALLERFTSRSDGSQLAAEDAVSEIAGMRAERDERLAGGSASGTA